MTTSHAENLNALFQNVYNILYVTLTFKNVLKKRTNICIDTIKTILLFSSVRSISNVCAHLYTHKCNWLLVKLMSIKKYAHVQGISQRGTILLSIALLLMFKD